ncbi:hypothetical protein EDB85DRAFT_77158 [Lactarius pseudohatsudake]|nr:hypothetical protein EDB85DRAFT_77158 [Lactarius pseudohatsudake]
MPGITTGLSLRLPSFLFSSAPPHLCLQWKTSLHLTRKPDGFEAPPIYVPWRDKFAYKFVVDGRWVTNDAEPTEVAPGGFVNNVYTAPPKPVLPEPEPSTAPPSYHSESEVEHEPAEKVADKPTTNGSILHVVRDTPTPTADAAPEHHPRVPDDGSDATVDPAPEAVQETVVPIVEAAQAAVSQVAPAPIKIEKVADEITSESEAPKDSPAPAASEPIQIPVPELAPNVPIGILPNSTPGGPSQDSTTPTTRVDSEREISTHVPLRFGSGTAVPQVEEAAPAPESVSRLEGPTPALVKEEEAPEETTPAPVEEEGEPEEATPAPVEEEGEPETTLGEPEETTLAPEEAALAPVEVEETEAPAVPESAPVPPTEPVPVPAAVEEPESASPQAPEEVTAPASQEPATVPEPSSEPAPKPEPVPEAKAEVAAVQVPAPEATPVAEPAPVVEATATKAPVAAPEPTPQVAPAVNGHSKTVSGASTSTAAPTLPETVGRKTSRKFSFPGHGKDKSGNSSPTGSSRFASQQKREKRHSLLHKLKEIFSDKGKKKSEAKA